MKKFLLILLAVLMLAAGCSKTGKLGGEAKYSDLPKIGMSLCAENEYQKAIAEKAKAAALEDGYELLVTYAENAESQNSDIIALVGAGAEAIIIYPEDIDALASSITECQNNNVPVINLMLPINSTVETLICPDYYLMGQKAARLANEAVVDNALEKGNAYIIALSSYAFDMQLMCDGFKAEIEGNDRLSLLGITNFEPENQAELTGFDISSIPESINIVFVQSEEMAQAFIKAAGEREFSIITIGGSEDIIKKISDKTVYASVFTGAEIGVQAADEAAKAASNESYKLPLYIEAKIGVCSESSANEYLNGFNLYAEPK